MKVLLLSSLIFLIAISKGYAQSACSVTLGYNGAATFQEINDNAQCDQFTVTSQAVNSFQSYVYSDGAAISAFYAVYSDSGGVPSALQFQASTEVQPPSGWSWIKLKFPGPISLKGTYWIVTQINSGYYAYANSTGFVSGVFTNALGQVFPNIVSGFVSTTNNAYPVFADYCP